MKFKAGSTAGGSSNCSMACKVMLPKMPFLLFNPFCELTLQARALSPSIALPKVVEEANAEVVYPYSDHRVIVGNA
jgi:hypothetical protein